VQGAKRIVGILSLLIAGPILGFAIGTIIAEVRAGHDPFIGDGIWMMMYGVVGAMFGVLASLIAVLVLAILRLRSKSQQNLNL
jgi:hypothetical protein